MKMYIQNWGVCVKNLYTKRKCIYKIDATKMYIQKRKTRQKVSKLYIQNENVYTKITIVYTKMLEKRPKTGIFTSSGQKPTFFNFMLQISDLIVKDNGSIIV